MTESNDNEYVGVVEKVIIPDQHGPYAVIRVKGLGSVTFSLEPPVWLEPDYPEQGTYVVLSQIRKKRAGWRAMKGRFMKPSDQNQQRNNNTNIQQGAKR